MLEAPDGRVGLDLMRESDEPLIVLLDLLLPTMSGVVLLHSLGAERTLAERHAFIIFSATRAFSAPTLQSYLPGKRLFDLPKPFDVDDLVAIVGQAARQLEGEHDAG